MRRSFGFAHPASGGKPICWKVGLERAAANEHYRYALCVVAWRLHGRLKSGSGSRRSFIAASRAVLW